MDMSGEASRFEGADDAVAVMGGFLRHFVESPGFSPDVAALDATILLRTSSPETTMLLDLRGERPTLHTSHSGSADLKLGASADVLNDLLLGALNPLLAVSDGSVRLSGPRTDAYLGFFEGFRGSLGPLYAERLVLAERESLLANYRVRTARNHVDLTAPKVDGEVD
jgi:hypothetical protein